MIYAFFAAGGVRSAKAATPAQAHAGITASEFVVLPGSSRMSQAERPDLTPGLIRGWLVGVEPRCVADRIAASR